MATALIKKGGLSALKALQKANATSNFKVNQIRISFFSFWIIVIRVAILCN